MDQRGSSSRKERSQYLWLCGWWCWEKASTKRSTSSTKTTPSSGNIHRLNWTSAVCAHEAGKKRVKKKKRKSKILTQKYTHLVLTGLALTGEVVLVFLRGGNPFGLLLFVNILKICFDDLKGSLFYQSKEKQKNYLALDIYACMSLHKVCFWNMFPMWKILLSLCKALSQLISVCNVCLLTSVDQSRNSVTGS